MAADAFDSVIDAHRLVGEKERARVTGVSRSGWRNLELGGRATGQKLVPDRIAVTAGKSAWRLADLIDWVRSRPAYEPAPAPRCTARKQTELAGRGEV